MNASISKWLMPIAVVLVVAAFFLRPQAGQTPQSQQLLLPQLAEQLDKAGRVELLGAGERVVVALVNQDGQWGLEQRKGYPIVLDSLRALLRALAQVKTDEAMTSNPEYYARLGLADIADANSNATGIRVFNANGDKIAGILVGNNLYRGDAEYSYLRVEGDSQSWLVKGGLDLVMKPVRWLDKTLLNIERSAIQQVHIVHADGEALTVKREQADDKSLTVQNLAADAELLYASVGNGPAEALQNLVLEDVQAAEEFEWTAAKLVHTTFTTNNGMVITVQAERRETEYFLALAVDYQGDDTAIKEEAERLNSRFNGWVYQVQTYKYQALAKRMEDMLKKP